MKVTDEILDALAAALVPRLEAISVAAYHGDLRPPAPTDQARPNGTGRGVLICGRCDQPIAQHSISGGCP